MLRAEEDKLQEGKKKYFKPDEKDSYLKELSEQTNKSNQRERQEREAKDPNNSPKKVNRQ